MPPIFFNTMKKKKKKKPDFEEDDNRYLEILKAVAQVWQTHTGTSNPATESDAHRRNSTPNPSRFKIEAIRRRCSAAEHSATLPWDFAQSLWDSYEIVTMSKKLERGLVLDGDGFRDADRRIHRRRRESCNSLRNLFNAGSSRRFNLS